MKNPTYELVPGGYYDHNAWVGVSWNLIGPGSAEQFSLQNSMPELHRNLLPEEDCADHALPSILLHLMSSKASLRIRGHVSPALLDGIDTLQSIWGRWRPQRYSRIEIVPDSERPTAPETGERHALFAFSGGVDATFSLFRHLHGAAGRTTRQPGAALLVHGMDIPLDREDFFDGAMLRAQRILDSTDVPLLPIRTNSRQLEQNWEDSYGLQLTGCFLLLQRHYQWALKGSGEPYEALVLPWGSTPLTDYLCGTETQSIIHDGAQFDRTEKVDWLARHTDVMADLRVCWAGANLDRNCGECEKCLRTMLNFWAMGHAVPAAFTTELTPARVKTLQPTNETQLHELRSVLTHATQFHGKGEPILEALRQVLFHAAVQSYGQRLRYRMRRLFKALTGSYR